MAKKSFFESMGGVSRRSLLKTAACAAGTVVVPAMSAGRAAAGETPDNATGEATRFEFEEATISDLQAKMKSGEISAHSLAEAYLARIRELDKTAVNSVIEVNPEALAIAESLDKERKEKGSRGPMHGIPVLIKDNIDTA